MLSQDPYPGENVADGLAFSASNCDKLPFSLNNIYNEIDLEFGLKSRRVGDLTVWAKQGVFLLNSSLTTRQGKSLAHIKYGWCIFTDEIIRKISQGREGIVFILLGNFSKKKKELIDCDKHCVLEASHPSPLSVTRGFYGSGVFKSCNDYLSSKGRVTINWCNM